jgi:hypothetical protein
VRHPSGEHPAGEQDDQPTVRRPCESRPKRFQNAQRRERLALRHGATFPLLHV